MHRRSCIGLQVVLLALILPHCSKSDPRSWEQSDLPFPRDRIDREAAVGRIFASAERELKEGNYTPSLAKLRAIQAIDPHHPLPSRGLLEILVRQGSLDGAERSLEDLSGNSDPALRYGRGILRLRQGNLAEAESHFTTAAGEYSALEHPAGMIAVLAGLGSVCARTSRLGEAQADYQRALRLAERLENRKATAEILVLLAAIRDRNGEEEEALADLRRARSIQKSLGDRDGLAITCYRIGSIHFQRGALAPALEAVRRALEIDRDRGDRVEKGRSLALLGRIRFAMGQVEGAEQFFQEAMGIALQIGDRATEAEAIMGLGRIDLRAGRGEEALEKQLRALAIRRELKDRAGEAESLYQTGLVQDAGGQPGRALRSFEAALGINRGLRNRRGEALLLHSLGNLRVRIGDRAEGIAALEGAVLILREIRFRKEEALVRLDLGRAFLTVADYSRALPNLDRARELFGALGERTFESASLRDIGILHRRLGDFRAAETVFREGLEREREIGNRKGESDLLDQFGKMRFAQGNFPEALRLQQLSLRIRRELGDLQGEAGNLGLLGEIYRSLGDPAKAKSFLASALERMVSLPDPAGAARAGDRLGILLKETGDYQGARREFQESIRVREENEDLRGSAFGRLRLADLLQLLGQSGEAEGEMEEALRIFRVIGEGGGEAMSLMGLGEIARARGRLATATDLYEEALAGATATGTSEAVWRSEAGIAGCMEAAGQWSQALKFYQQAITHRETIRPHRLEKNRTGALFTEETDLHEKVVWLLWNHGRSFLDSDLAARGFELAEQARSGHLLRLLARTGSDLSGRIDPDLRSREARVLARITQLQDDLRSPREAEEREPIRASLEEIGHELELLKAEVRAASPDYSEIAYPEPISSAEVRSALLRPDEVMLAYLLGEKASYLWRLSRGEVEWWELPPREAIENSVRNFLGLLRAAGTGTGSDLAALSRSLAETLLPPDSLPVEGPLLVIPDGILHYLPFEALRVRGKAGSGRYLLQSHEISYLSSASLLRLLRTRNYPAREGHSPVLLAIGDPPTANLPPTWQIPTLPFAHEEVVRIGDLFGEKERSLWVGSLATESVVKADDVERYRFIHIAGTGWINEEVPVGSGVFLGAGSKPAEDGLLRLNEIFRLHLGAELVVLSGSRIGFGRQVRGDGMVGLTRAWIYAGARSVIVSLWDRKDQSAAELMEIMYRHLIRGESPAAALRQAKLAMLRKEGDAAMHPWRWAGFLLSGDPGRSFTPVTLAGNP